jgi:hypothetical protein
MNEDMEMRSLEARRVYCAFMNKHIRSTKGYSFDYGRKVMPHYDGTSTERPKHGKAVVHKSGRDYKPVWPKIAKSALDNSLTILELIRAQFDAAVGGPPSANSCHGARAVRTAMARRESALQDSANLFNSFKQTIDVDLTTMHKFLTSKEAVSDIVLLSKVSAMCKVNILMMMQLEDYVPPDLLLEAAEDYMLQPDIYDLAWSGALHSSFLDKATKHIQIKRIEFGIRTDKVVL